MNQVLKIQIMTQEDLIQQCLVQIEGVLNIVLLLQQEM